MKSVAEIVSEIVPDQFINEQAGRLAGTMRSIRGDIGFAIAQAREDGARWMQRAATDWALTECSDDGKAEKIAGLIDRICPADVRKESP